MDLGTPAVKSDGLRPHGPSVFLVDLLTPVRWKRQAQHRGQRMMKLTGQRSDPGLDASFPEQHLEL